MKSLDEILNWVIKLPYDMQVTFRKTADPKIVEAVFALRLVDASLDVGGKKRVSVEFLQQVSEETIIADFQRTALSLIPPIS